MLPLRATESVKKFPKGILVFIVFLIALQIFTYIAAHGNHSDFILSLALNGEGFLGLKNFFKALLLHENFFSLWISCVYLWSFAPRLFERRPFWSIIPEAVLATACSASFYYAYHGVGIHAYLLLGQVFISALLGVAMKGEIWSTVNTLVIGPKILQVFEVPSYVLLFFWFFYIMLGNLFMSVPFSEAPTIYFLPLVAFLVGFLLELATEKFIKTPA